MFIVSQSASSLKLKEIRALKIALKDDALKLELSEINYITKL